MLSCWQKMNKRNLDWWINIKFCVKTDKDANETLTLLQMVYGEHEEIM